MKKTAIIFLSGIGIGIFLASRKGSPVRQWLSDLVERYQSQVNPSQPDNSAETQTVADTAKNAVSGIVDAVKRPILSGSEVQRTNH